ncbi:hypothetical protein PsYK624_057430 [Phanerochaete sordida]|uniref:BTB domain-containing protein n=1 Tax=Phanerochaete sordida TaxID=48140 RepID=A0A9P3G893_9APHY|nr:hypothetical protein PsYK624_057430 [Phanerochaete sordida]
MDSHPHAFRKRPRPASFEDLPSATSRARQSANAVTLDEGNIFPHKGSHSASESAPHYGRSRHVWYDDGNALIRCTSPAGVTVFRVHLTLLLRYSLAFRGDLVLNPIFDKVEMNSHGSGSTYILDVTVERIQEFEHFLRAVYEHRYFSRSSSLDMDAVLGMLRLGRKFKAPALVEEATERLLDVRLYAMRSQGSRRGVSVDDAAHEDEEIGGRDSDEDDVKGWEVVKRDERHRMGAHTLPVRWDPAYTLPLANLAHQLDLPDVLAFMLYLCSIADASNITQGSTLSDGTHTRLPDDLIAKLVDGKARLAAWSSDYVWAMNSEPMGSPVCVRGLALDGCWGDYEFMPESKMKLDKMHPVEAVDEWKRQSLKQNLCGHCVRWVEEEHAKTVEALLVTVIPECFGL